jgi:hypothetical protein
MRPLDPLQLAYFLVAITRTSQRMRFNALGIKFHYTSRQLERVRETDMYQRGPVDQMRKS